MNGRFISKAASRAVEHRVYEVMRRGHREIAKRELLVHGEEIIKTTEPGIMDKPGRMRGRIDDALYRTNVTTVRNAKRVEFVIKAKDSRDKEHRFRGSVMIDTPRKRKMQPGLIVGTIIGHLQSRGFRTGYRPEGISETRWRKTKAGKKKLLHDIQITVRVLR